MSSPYGVAQNGYTGGMDQDTSIKKYRSDKYFDALNMTLTAPTGVSMGNLENEKGNSLSFTFPDVVTGEFYNVDYSGTEDTWSGDFVVNTTSYTIPSGTRVKDIVATIASSVSGDGDVEAYSVRSGYGYVKWTTGIKLAQKNERITILGSGLNSLNLIPAGGTATSSTSSVTFDDQTVIGNVNIRNSLILFTTDKENTSSSPSGTIGAIWKIQYNSSDSVVDIDTNTLVIEDHLINAGEFDFSTYYDIQAVAHYINEEHGNVYFTNFNNDLMFIDVLDRASVAEKPGYLKIIPLTNYSKPKVTDVFEGGGHKAGVVQYAYQYYNKFGAESIISPLSQMINLTASSYTEATTSNFLGSPQGDNTGKAVRLEIPEPDSSFDHIRVFSLHYSDDVSPPEVKIIADKKVRQVSTIELIDDGVYAVGVWSFQEFRNYDKMLFACKTLAYKDERLICGNIKKSNFDVDYDARAYRYSSGGTFELDDVTGLDSANYSDIEDFADCVLGDYSTYKYQDDGTNLGGTGPNVEYGFETTPIKIDIGRSSILSSYTRKEQQIHSNIDSNFADNDYYTDYSSPMNSGQVLGYRRGETYRFGVHFINSYGQRSPVKWIGDIKFPEQHEAGMVTSSAEEYTTRILVSPDISYDWSEDDNGDKLRQLVTVPSDTTHTYSFQFGGVTTSLEVICKEFSSSNDYGTTVGGYVRQVKEYIRNKYGDNILVSEIDGSVAQTFKIQLTARYYSNSDTSFVEANNTLDQGSGAVTFSETRDYDATITYTTAGGHIATVDSDGSILANVLYPKFTINNIPTDDDGNTCSYQIVRVKREEEDKTKVAQGLVLPTEEFENIRYPINTLNQEKQFNDSASTSGKISSLTETIVNFISPEVNFRKVNVVTGDSLTPVGFTGRNVSSSEKDQLMIYKFYSNLAIDGTSKSIDAASIVNAEDDVLGTERIHYIGDYRVSNMMKSPDDVQNIAIAGTSMYIDLDFALSIDAAYNDNYAICDIDRTLAKQYGGNTYGARENSIYIDCNHFNDGSSSTNYVFGGDTYIGMFDYLRAMWSDADYLDSKDSLPYSQVIFFPVETSVNMSYRYDKCFSRKHRFFEDEDKYLQERAGDYSGRVGGDQNYVQEYDLYLENRAYSRNNDSLIYLPKDIDFEETEKQDSIIVISEKFDSRSKVDQLIKFLSDNYKPLNSGYGPINNITNFRDKLIVFQDKAIANQEINERALVNDQTGASLVLGTGDVLGNYSYITTSSGSKHRNSVVVADSGLYYFDVSTRSFNKLSYNDLEISTVKGMTNYFDRNISKTIFDYDNPLSGYGFHCVYDERNKRILMSYRNNLAGFTLGYNELLEVFESRYSFNPNIYIKDFENRILSVDPDNPTNVYLHGSGNYGQYYGTYEDSFVNILINKDPEINKIFTNIEFDTLVLGASQAPYGSSETYPNDTISQVYFYNNYQNSGTLDVVTTTPGAGEIKTKKRFRKWRMAVPRISEVATGREVRMSSTHMFVDFYFTNNANKKFILNDLLSYYIRAQY